MIKCRNIKYKNVILFTPWENFFQNLKRHAIFFGLVTVLSFTLFSCHKDNTPDQFFTGKSYFPLETGNEIIYRITEINIDKASAIYDTTVYQIKERIDSLFTDASGKPAYRLERYWRMDTAAQWVIKDVWEVQINELNVQKVEENIRFVKLVFPAETGQVWDGNAYNDLDAQDYQILTANIPETINNLPFDSVLTVEQQNEESLISKKYEVEKFANGIGLVYKETTDLYSQSMIGSGIPIEQRVDEGTVYKQEIVAY
ncbi:MAG: hypothetical protein J7L46_02365 [Bacteroidales bacterium]|nr:hypothetical protein [Bacteroidales bacterium]